MLYPLRSALLLAITAVVLAAPARANAYTFRRAADGQPVRWRAERVELRVDPALTGDRQSARDAVGMAAAAWATPASAPALVVGGDTQEAPGHHVSGHENGIYLVRGAWRYGPSLAVTVTTAIEATGEIVDTDVLVSARPDILMAHREGDHAYDLVALLAHELGHVLGLGESDVVGATMYPSLSRGDLGPRTIENDDEQGVLAAYQGARPTATYGCAAAPGARGAMSVLLAFGLALVLATRRRAAPLVALGLAALLVGFDPPPETLPAPVDRAAYDALFAIEPVRGSVDAVEVIERDGFFVTRCTVATQGGPRTLDVPGGARDGLVQLVGEALPPAPGDELILGARGAWAFASPTHAWGGWLERDAPVSLPETSIAR